MKIAIITHTAHKIKNNQLFAYEPYVREMDLWLKNFKKYKVVAPVSEKNLRPIDKAYKFSNIQFTQIPAFNITTIFDFFRTLVVLPLVFFKIYKAMKGADHIHVRCPGNVGLVACFVQLFFPKKQKTFKYAGNWDPTSKQPLSYKVQKWILSNTFLTKNSKVLVYGNWPKQSKNIIPFFTASFSKKEVEAINKKKCTETIYFMFAGALSRGKNPLLCIKVVQELNNLGYKSKLDIYGEGKEFNSLQNYIKNNNLYKFIHLNGNISKQELKQAFKKAHFLLAPSKSEGWPKVVAEAMFFGCLPVAGKVSCIPEMLDKGERGILSKLNVKDMVSNIEKIIINETLYDIMIQKAALWSQQFTLEKFESEIQYILTSFNNNNN